MRRTKIVCTIGRTTLSRGFDRALSMLARAGMNVLRMNMSYAGGDYLMERGIIDWARGNGYRIDGQAIAILADLQGIKYRVRGLPGGAVEIQQGQEVRLVADSAYAPDGSRFLPLPDVLHQNLLTNLQAGMTYLKVYFGDGDIILLTEGLEGDCVRCRALLGGTLKEGKGITLQGIDVTPEDPLTEKDKADLRFIASNGGVTFLALSFAQSGEDIRRVRTFLVQECGLAEDKVPPIIAKIETQRGYNNIESILDEAYGVMVARGDLGLQVGVEQVTEIQKELIYRCRVRGRPVITATQMLESMETGLEPKRAEVSDIFNAVLDGTDAVMLSGETSAGRHPEVAVAMMARIVRAAEGYLERRYQADPLRYTHRVDELQHAIAQTESTADRSRIIGHTISHAAASFAGSPQLKPRAIITPTASGASSLRISRFRPPVMIVAAAHKLEVVHRLVLSYGVVPLYIRQGPTSTVEQVFGFALRQAARQGLVKEQDLVIFSGGYPLWEAGSTNLVKIHVVSAEEVNVSRGG